MALGDHPSTQIKQVSSHLFFHQSEAIIKIDLSGTDVVKAIAELDAQPERLERISRRNVANCLLKHDWSYHWRDILAQLEGRMLQITESKGFYKDCVKFELDHVN